MRANEDEFVQGKSIPSFNQGSERTNLPNLHAAVSLTDGFAQTVDGRRLRGRRRRRRGRRRDGGGGGHLLRELRLPGRALPRRAGGSGGLIVVIRLATALSVVSAKRRRGSGTSCSQVSRHHPNFE